MDKTDSMALQHLAFLARANTVVNQRLLQVSAALELFGVEHNYSNLISIN